MDAINRSGLRVQAPPRSEALNFITALAQNELSAQLIAIGHRIKARRRAKSIYSARSDRMSRPVIQGIKDAASFDRWHYNPAHLIGNEEVTYSWRQKTLKVDIEHYPRSTSDYAEESYPHCPAYNLPK